jgi:PAS domain S-box-containing protein
VFYDEPMKNDKFSRIVSYERLEDFLENATVCIHLVDGNGDILYANRAELDLLGYKEEEYIGHSIKDFHEDPQVINAILDKLLRREELINYESVLVCKDGSKKNVLISSNVFTENNEFRHTRCFTRDITYLKKSEKLLRLLNHASEKLSRTLDTQEALDQIITFIVPDYADWFAIYELKKDDSVGLIKMAHADPDKIEWANQFMLKYPIDLNESREGSMAWVMNTGKSFLAHEVSDEMISVVSRSEEHYKIIKNLAMVSLMFVPMVSQGKVIGVVSFISSNPLNKYDEQDLNFAKDFTNRLALTLDNTRLYEAAKYEIQQRIEADKRKDEFISIASHELKTPVTSLKAYTQILQANMENMQDSNIPMMLAKMNSQVDKLTGLIIDLLDVTKIQTGEMTYDLEVFDFDSMVSEIVEEMQRTTSQHEIIFNAGKCDGVKADKNRLAQVVTNLISNAIKYSPGGGKIIITSKCADHKIYLSVKDSGIGIPDKEKDKIFRRFFRVVDNKTQHTYPGLGLGLYISASIIKRHQGELSFTSDEHKGSVFSFWLPTK